MPQCSESRKLRWGRGAKGILPSRAALQSFDNPLKKDRFRKQKNMKTRWFTNAAIAVAALCSASGLLYAQSGDAPVPVTRSVWSGVYSLAQARRGQETYYQVCAECHGRELEGDDSEGVTPLAGPHFMTNWDTHTAADLVKRIHAQPNDEPGDIDLPTQIDLFAFIMAFNQVPAGAADLSDDRRTEAAIGITAQPPEGITPNATP
jgi:hypothetical protein